MFYNTAFSWARGARRYPFVVPPTSSSTLIFYYDRSKKKFDKNFYSPALTGGRLSTEQMKQFLREIELILKKKSRPIGITIAFFIFMIIFGFWMICSMFDDSYDSFDDSSDVSDDVDDFLFTMLIYFLAMIIGAIGIQIYSREANKKAQRSIQALIDRDQPAFAAQGLKWNMPLQFPLWIELWTNYREDLTYTGMQPTPLPVTSNSYNAFYQPQSMIQQQAPTTHLAFMNSERYHSNGVYPTNEQQQQRPFTHQFYQPLIESDDNTKIKYPQLVL